MNNVEETLAKLAEIGNEVQRKLEEAKKMRKDALEPFLESLAETGEVSLITIYGYTPGFNDGDACEHSSEMFVNVEDAAGEEKLGLSGELDDLIEELEENPDKLSEEEICKKYGHVFKSPSNELVSAIYKIIHDTVDEENDTNYYVVFILENGKFERYEGEYYCGW